MSDENKQEVTQEVKQEEKKCDNKIFKILVIVSLLFSISALILSGIAINGTSLSGGEHGKVVISKQYDKGKSIEKAMAKEKPMIVFFYTDWCGFCQRFAPTFYKVTKNKNIKKNFAVAYVNCEVEKNHKHMQEYNVQGFPTVYVVKKDGSKVQLTNDTFFNEDSVDVVTENALKAIDAEDDD